MGYSKNEIKRKSYLWEIDNNNFSNIKTGTIEIFEIPAGSIVKSVGALVETVTTEHAAIEASAITVATDLITTATAHGFTTGLLVAASTETTLPAGLTATDYYVIYESDTTFKLATSVALAEAGTALTITDEGTGAHTFTPTAFTVEVGDGTDPNGFIVDGFTDTVGYYPSADLSTYSGAYCLADTGFALDKYYADSDTIDFTITGVAKSGKVRFFVEFVELI